MQSLAVRSVTCLPKQTTRQNRRSARICCVAQAPSEVSRRQTLSLWIPAVVAGVVLATTPGAALANNTAPKSASAASMSSFTMEGTKKQGVSPKRKAAVLQKLKESIAAGDLS